MFQYKKTTYRISVSGFLVLSDQESNLDSSDPESDVLPVTPSDNLSKSLGAGVKSFAKVSRFDEKSRVGLIFFGFGPGILQGDYAVEDRLSGL